MTIFFISGHLKISEEEFSLHYKEKIIKEIQNGNSFIVGDCAGVDCIAQKLIKENNGNAVVYHMFDFPRNNAGFPTVGGFKSDEERDSAMTRDSDLDIAWVRPGREKSGTAKNIKRRNGTLL